MSLRAEIRDDVTALVRELCAHYWPIVINRAAPQGLIALCRVAHNLLADRIDYEGAARAAGWLPEPGDTLGRVYLDKTQRDGEDESYYHASSWEEACDRLKLDPPALPIVECRSVSEWLGDRLAERGERVSELSGLFVWARTARGDVETDETIRRIWLSVSEVPEHDGDEA